MYFFQWNDHFTTAPQMEDECLLRRDGNIIYQSMPECNIKLLK